jgi:adenylate kinase family enzyme
VIGTTGSGKTTLAQTLAYRLGLRHIELDALFWGPNWKSVEPEQFRQRIRETIAAAPDGWVTDGNYRGHTAHITWVQADAIVWLDYPIWRVYKQLFLRTTGRALTGIELWSGNRESLRTAFLTRDSLFVWALRSHWRHRREWEALFAEPEFAHVRVVRLRSPAARDRLLAALATRPIAYAND